VQRIPKSESHLYGIVSGKEIDDNVLLIDDIAEKPSVDEAKSDLAVIGRYIFSPTLFGYLEETSPDDKGEVQLTDAVRMMVAEEEVLAFRFEGKRFDIGSNLGWIVANIELGLKRRNLGPALGKYLREHSPKTDSR